MKSRPAGVRQNNRPGVPRASPPVPPSRSSPQAADVVGASMRAAPAPAPGTVSVRATDTDPPARGRSSVTPRLTLPALSGHPGTAQSSEESVSGQARPVPDGGGRRPRPVSSLRLTLQTRVLFAVRLARRLPQFCAFCRCLHGFTRLPSPPPPAPAACRSSPPRGRDVPAEETPCQVGPVGARGPLTPAWGLCVNGSTTCLQTEVRTEHGSVLSRG